MRSVILVAACAALMSGCSYYTSIEHTEGHVYLTQHKIILGFIHRGRIWKCTELGDQLTCHQMDAND